MFGTIAKYRAKPGHEDEIVAELKRFEESQAEGWLYATAFRSVSDPREFWISVVFESEDAYRRNADRPEMDQEYRRLLEHLEGEPEWHDGNVVYEGMHKPATA